MSAGRPPEGLRALCPRCFQCVPVTLDLRFKVHSRKRSASYSDKRTMRCETTGDDARAAIRAWVEWSREGYRNSAESHRRAVANAKGDLDRAKRALAEIEARVARHAAAVESFTEIAAWAEREVQS